MATTKLPPALPARTGSNALRTNAMKASPVVVKTSAATSAVAPAGGGMVRETLVIAFVDLARFQIASRRVKDDVLVEVLEDYYERIADSLKPAGGRVVKFMGDGALVVFAADRASQAARALLMLKSDVDARLAKRRFLGSLVARVNVGEVMAGSFGPKSDKRFDVIGQAVNRTAAMRFGDGISLTTEAWGRVDAKTQKLFRQRGDYYVPA